MNKNSDNLLSQLGQRLGLDLIFDDVRQCFLMFDEQMVSIRCLPDSWTFYGMLTELRALQEESFWRHLMVLNLSLLQQRAGTVALEPEANVLVYGDSLPLPAGIEEVWDKLERFVECHERVCARLALGHGALDSDHAVRRGGLFCRV